jgi:ABC-type sugar transport system ATPase subunit
MEVQGQRYNNTDSEPVVHIDKVTHHYGSVLALDSITLDIPAGIMVGVIGPDGVGKSTLLGIMAGAKQIQHGSMTDLGGSIEDMSHRRSVWLCVWSLSAWTLSSSAGKKTEPLSPVTGLTKP